MSTPMTMKTIVFSSLFFAAQVLAQAQEKPPNTGYNGGEDNPQDPDDAGSEGASKGAFSISKGGLAAIIVVAVLVVIGGVASAVLFWLAKKKQWDVRQSIRRASRRITGRGGPEPSKRQNRRTGVRLNDPPPPRNGRMNQMHDLEKGFAPKSSLQPKTTTTITGNFKMDSRETNGMDRSHR